MKIKRSARQFKGKPLQRKNKIRKNNAITTLGNKSVLPG